MKPNRIQLFLLYCFGISPTLTQFRKVFHNSDNNDQLLVPDESRKYRRDLLLLASIVILAGLTGGGPEDINFFGLQPSDKGDVRWF